MDMAFAFLYPGMSWFFYILMPLAPAIYLIVRWRTYRENGPADPQLGVKTVLYYFRTLGYHVILAAQFCLLYGLMDEEARWHLLRVCAALILAGGLVYGLHVWFITRRTNTEKSPAVARLYNGFNALICGLVGMGSLIAALVAVLAEDVSWDVFKASAALFVVYGSAWCAQTSLLVRRSLTRPEK